MAHGTHSRSIFSKASALPALAFVVPSLPKRTRQTRPVGISKDDARNEDHIPFAILQSALGELLKINRFLLQLVSASLDLVLIRNATAIFSDFGETV